MMMDIINILKSCLKELKKNDFILLENDVSERAITHKLAEYLQKRFPEYHVDCEYNRDFERGKYKPKYLKLLEDEMDQRKKLFDEKDEELQELSIYPDIIVHIRGTNKDNLLVVEVKKHNRSGKEFDFSKLKSFTSSSNDNNYKYEFGLFVRIFVREKAENNSEMILFQNGKELDKV